ncbi:MAG: helix-turn-helix domain-containing protein [Candidatus Nanoarchaeia archaeon]
MDAQLKTQLLSYLQTKEHGATVKELCELLQVERHTLTKYLESLQAENLLINIEIGRNKLWSLNKTPLIDLFTTPNPLGNSFKELLNNLDEQVSLVSKDKHVLWSNNKIISKATKCYEQFNQLEPCSNCPAERTLQSGQKEIFHQERLKISTIPIKDIDGQTVAFLELVKHQ